MRAVLTGITVFPPGTTRAALVTLAWCLLLGPSPLRAADTGSVRLTNGTEVLGEVKGLDLGKLELSTGAMSTIYIKWDRVAAVRAPERFEVETADGRRYYGQLQPASAGKLGVLLADRVDELDLWSVVRLRPIKQRFWRRLDGSINLGATYSQSSGVAQGTLNTSVMARRPTFESSTSLSVTLTRQPDVPRTSRGVLTVGYSKLLANRWFIPGTGRFEQNSDLGLRLRSALGIGVGRFLIQTNRSRLTAAGGAIVNRESPYSGDTTINVEAALATGYSFFTYDTPKTSITTNVAVFPSLSNPGRIRSELDVNVQREIVKDFTIGVIAYNSSDNRPPEEGAAKNDFGFTLSVGWAF